MRLFVDIDDTLVSWEGPGSVHPYGNGAEGWHFSAGVIAYIRQWVTANPDGVVVFWSGGGRDYAWGWGLKAQESLGLKHVSFAGKGGSFQLKDGDTFLDDSPADFYKDRNIHPNDLYKHLHGA